MNYLLLSLASDMDTIYNIVLSLYFLFFGGGSVIWECVICTYVSLVLYIVTMIVYTLSNIDVVESKVVVHTHIVINVTWMSQTPN